MKTYFITILICAVACVTCFADAPRIGSTVGSPTVPPSSYQQGLRPSGDDSIEYQMRNEMVTGNVPGGRHFRGEIPYSPRYEFSGPLPSDGYNAFVRRSSITPYRDQDPARYDPYYLPSRTITSLTRVGQSGLVPPQVTFPGGTGEYELPPPPTRQMYDPNPYRTRRPLEMNIDELELKVLRQAQQENPDLQYLREGVQEDIIKEVIANQKIQEDDQERPPAKPEEKVENPFINKPDEVLKPFDPEKPMDPDMDAKLARLLKEMDEQAERDRQIEDTIGKPEAEPIEEDKAEDRETTEDSEQTKSEGPFSKMDHQTAMGIIHPYKTFAEYAKAKVNIYTGIGDSFMKKSRFYKAADAYELALVYDLENADAYGRRGLALFAAGEYLTCVDYIERALSISPQYAKEKIDLKTFIGQEVLDERLPHILQWYDTNKSSRFILLASYIYYQLGDLEKALESLEKAAEKMPGSASVGSMRSAITSAQAGKK